MCCWIAALTARGQIAETAESAQFVAKAGVLGGQPTDVILVDRNVPAQILLLLAPTDLLKGMALT